LQFLAEKIYSNIREVSPGSGRQTTVGLSKTANFSIFAGYFFPDILDMRPGLLYDNNHNMESVVSFSVIPK